ELPDGLVKQAAIELKPDRRDEAVLLGTQEVARAPDLKVPHRDLKARSQLGKLLDGLQPLFGVFAQHFVPPVGEVGVGQAVGAADSPPQLVQLGQSEAIRVVDDQGVDV